MTLYDDPRDETVPDLTSIGVALITAAGAVLAIYKTVRWWLR